MAEALTFYDVADPKALQREYPIGAAFEAFAKTVTPEALRALQEQRFQVLLARAWRTAFYQRLWGAAGIEPGDIRSLDDLPKLPTFGKAEIVDSIARHPPFGDFAGLDSYPSGEVPPVIFHTTSGTTGTPQPLLFGPKSREVQNLLLGRLYRMQGLGAGDVAHSVYGHGMINGGHYIREAVTRFTAATFMSAGAGVETRSAQQVQLMKAFSATVILGFADYVKKLAEVAAQEGLTIGEDIRISPVNSAARTRTRSRPCGAERRVMIGTASATPASSPVKPWTGKAFMSLKTPMSWRLGISTRLVPSRTESRGT